jgi:hypothetical protein
MWMSEDAKVHDRRLYGLLHVAEEDLRQASFFAAHILKKGWHFEPWEKRWTVYMQQAAFTTALATAYSRPFTESRGWPKFPNSLLAAFNAEQRTLHKGILNLRNLIYAHSDVGSRVMRPVSFEGIPTAIEALPPMRFTRDEITELQSMIKIAQNSIGTRKRELIEAVAREA